MLADLVELFGCNGLNNFGKAHSRALRTRKVIDGRAYRRELTSPKNPWVAGEDLFDQRAAGPGHSEDEYWHPGLIADAAFGAHQLRGEHRADALERLQLSVLVIKDPPPFEKITRKELRK